MIPDARAGEEVQDLREQLADETFRREELERKLAAQPAPVAASPPLEEALRRAPGPIERASEESRAHAAGWIDEPALLDAGFTLSEVDALRDGFEAIELRRLFIRDQATREGWFGKPRYNKRMRTVNEEYEAFREEYGDERYDWIRFASNRNNRVVVQRVIGKSAAEEVGLEVGDVFLRYDDERIFDTHALQRATSSGEFGETVAVDVERGGERIRVYPPRGPLGIGLTVVRREPAPLY